MYEGRPLDPYSCECFIIFETMNLRLRYVEWSFQQIKYKIQNERIFHSQFYNDPILRKNYLSSKHCLLLFFDLLFKQKQYAEFLQHFHELRKQLDSKQHTIMRSIFILAFATCYSQVGKLIPPLFEKGNTLLFLRSFMLPFQNTAKSFDYATQLHDQYKDLHITQDHLVFLSALALNQNAPHIAEQLLPTLWPSAHEAIPSLRVIALIRMQKFVDALQILRSVLVVYDDSRTQKNDVISREAVRDRRFHLSVQK